MFCIFIFEIVSFVCFILFNQEYFYSQFNIELKKSPPTQHNMILINYFITTTNDTIDAGSEKRSMISMIKETKVNTNNHKKILYIYNSFFVNKPNDIDSYPYYTALMYDERTLSLLFTCNALWYTEDDLKGHSYHFNVHTIFSLIFSWIIYRVIIGFVYYASFLHTCIEEIHYDSIQGHYISKIISNIISKIFVFFCVSFVLNLFVLYYLTIFYTLFNTVQFFCFVDSIISLVIGLVISVVYSLLFAFMKTIVIRKKIKSIYNVVLYLKNIL